MINNMFKSHKRSASVNKYYAYKKELFDVSHITKITRLEAKKRNQNAILKILPNYFETNI